MSKRDVCQRSCRMGTKNELKVVPVKGAHIRKNKTPLKRGRRNGSSKSDSRVSNNENVVADSGRVSCRKCRHEFDNQSSFQDHSCAEESELYQCHTCKLLFNHRKRFQEHMKQHRQNECKMCGQQFLRRKALLVHSKSMHGVTELEKHYSCSYCDRKFIKRPSLIAHLKTHADSNKIVCLKCGTICENEEEHRKHMEGHQSESNFECVRCGTTYRRRQQYDQHMAGHDKHDCHLCQINFSTKKLLEKHKKSVHDISTTPVKNHECPMCGKKFYRPATLKTHLKTHADANNPPVRCLECKKYFRSETSLAKHMKTTSHNRNEERKSGAYLCATCGKKFSHTQGLNRHMLLVHGDREDQLVHCDTCSYKTRSKNNLKRHMEIHSEKRYICEICGSFFHAHATLKQHHSYVHSERRDFVCASCNKAFKRLSALQRHERVHSEARPFACHCGQKYKRKSHLKRHMATVHEASNGDGVGEETLATDIVEEDAGQLPPPQVLDQNSISTNSPDNDLLLLNDCQHSVQPYLNTSAVECHQVVDEIAYLNSDLMQIPDDVMPMCQGALEQSLMGLEHMGLQGDSVHIPGGPGSGGAQVGVDTSNSLICPMSVLDNMELQPNYCLQNDSMQMTEMMLKPYRDEGPLLPYNSNDCSNMNLNTNQCNFESYLCAFREPNQYDLNNYQQYHF